MRLFTQNQMHEMSLVKLLETIYSLIEQEKLKAKKYLKKAQEKISKTDRALDYSVRTKIKHQDKFMMINFLGFFYILIIDTIFLF